MNETLKHIRHVLSENPVTMLAAALFALFVLIALVGPALVPHDPLASNATAALQPPSAAHWFGTDALGRDIFSRTMVATRLDLGIAISAVVLSFALGIALGLAAGFFGGWWDTLITRASDTSCGISRRAFCMPSLNSSSSKSSLTFWNVALALLMVVRKPSITTSDFCTSRLSCVALVSTIVLMLAASTLASLPAREMA